MSARGTCAACGRDVHIRIDGRLRTHRDLEGQGCPGSFREPAGPPGTDVPHVAELDETTSEWLRIAARNLGLTLSEATTYAVCTWLHLPLPHDHPLALEASA